MNIFCTSSSPVESAQFLDDKRVVKMVLESAQLLSTALMIRDPEFYGNHSQLYKPTHSKHPCTIWAACSDDNLFWLYEHYLALMDEYSFRYDKNHKCAELQWIFEKYFRDIGYVYRAPEEFVNCARNNSAGIDCTEMEDTHEAYREYLSLRWETDKRKPTWRGRG